MVKHSKFRSEGENTFVAEFATARDRDRVWNGSPWHVSKNAVILAEFEDCMKPSELRFDQIQLWARCLNLPFNLREKKWWLPIARKIDKDATEVEFNNMGGYLRARVTVEVANPLRRCIVIESARRQSMDVYEVQYEQIPHFCFSCGRLGHSDLFCHNPGTRDSNGNLQYGKGLRAPDEKWKTSYSEGSNGEQSNSKAEARSSSNADGNGTEATSPLKKNNRGALNKRKAGAQTQYYRKVQTPSLMIAQTAFNPEDMSQGQQGGKEAVEENTGLEPDPKKKRPTPTNSENMAVAAEQPCWDQ
jgi:hypothetical protein